MAFGDSVMHPHRQASERDAADLTENPRLGLSSCLPLLEALPDAMFLVDHEGRIVNANRSAMDMFLLDVDSVRGESMQSLLPDRLGDRTARPRDAGDGDAPYARSFEDRELLATRGNGTKFHAELMLSRIPLSEGDYVLAAVRDITTRKRAEVEMQRHAKDMEEFAAAVTHDLKAPLTGIEWLTKEVMGALGRKSDAADTLDILARILQSTSQMRDLIDGLLEVARFGIDAGSASFGNARDVAEDVKSTLESSATQRGVGIDIGSIDVHTLPIASAHLRQVMHNLISNAVKYVPAETGRILINVEEQYRPDGERVAHVITDDNGPGVPEEDRERIFEVFQRGAQDAAKPGVGLGLSLVRKVSSLYGGRTWVEPSPLGGARFVVELPLGMAMGGARAALDRLTHDIHQHQGRAPVTT